MSNQMLTVRGCSYHVQVTGEDGPPVLLLHGFTGNGDSWSRLTVDWLTPAQWVAVDLLGHGQTDAPVDPARYAMAQTVADLADLMTQLGHAQFDCVGYSMGGRVALSLALAHPSRVRSLTLESASPGLRAETERAVRRDVDAQLADFIEHSGVPAFVERWERLPLFSSQMRLAPAVWARQRANRLSQRAVGLANSLRGVGTGSQPSWWGNLGNLTLPVLLVTGELDEKYTAIGFEMAAMLPNVRHIHVPDAGHTVHLERPDVFAAVVADFIVTCTQ